MNSQPLVAIVILNYNGTKYLKQFLPTVQTTDYSNFKIIVADNASTDDSIQYMQEHHPMIELIQLSKNYGFAEGYNQALKQIHADYFILLNSDIEVAPNWVTPIINMMEKNSNLAICQPKILSYNQKEKFEYAGAAGGWIDYLGYPLARGRVFETIENDEAQYNNNTEIFWATGAAMFIKSKVYKELGGLYGYFFAHQEEIDLCWRAQLAGYKIGCCTQSVVYHVGGGTLPKGHRKTFLNFRNNLVMLSRNLPTSEKVWKIPVRLVLDGVFGCKCIFSGDFVSVKAILQAHGAYYKWLFSTQEKTNVSKKSMKQLNGVLHKSVVWQYFVRKKKIFQDFF